MQERPHIAMNNEIYETQLVHDKKNSEKFSHAMRGGHDRLQCNVVGVTIDQCMTAFTID